MGFRLELSEELRDRLDRHRKEGETYEQFLEELIAHYEAQGSMLWEGYDGGP